MYEAQMILSSYSNTETKQEEPYSYFIGRNHL